MRRRIGHSVRSYAQTRLPAKLVLVCAATALALLGGCNKKPAAPPQCVTINGHTWHVEMAVTPEQREEGLAHRTGLPPDQGMLFVFEEPESRRFWMKGCEMAIDIAFIGPDFKVVRTYTMYPEPGKLDAELTEYPSVQPALYALEVSAGDLAAAGVKQGDVVNFSPAVALSTKAKPSAGR